ncbi:MAG: glycosyltransferase family 2 protein [Nitrospinota bacterium]|nr:glycosyltransferase family 2 protein [Nitrospinota bacterium]MDH5790098.1 glycosyltransferase family 2 protein [Nitrospinota bacterium]
MPAYNEELRLGRTLPILRAWLESQEYTWEIVLVDAGSSDRTREVFHEVFSPEQGRSFKNEMNRGKGYAIRRGIREAKGEVLLFSDADFSTPIEEFPKLAGYLENGYDIAIGSRSLPDSNVEVHQAWVREGMGKVFNLLVQAIVLRGFIDTQCGFKCVKRERVLPLLPKMAVDGFCYDVELLFLAKKAGLKIVEVPVTWVNDPVSKVHILKDSTKMFLDLLWIRFRDGFGQYD